MKRFSTFLIEAKMTMDDALKIMGLTRGKYTPYELKQRYRELSRANHPDFGGSTEKMQSINAANDILSGTGAATFRQPEESREDRKAKEMAFAQVARESFDAVYVPAVFTKHFSSVMGEAFTITKDEWLPFNGYYGGSSVHRVVEWANESRTVVFYLSLSVSFLEMYKARTLSSPDAFLSTTIMSEILVNRKKVKLSQDNWTWAKTKERLTNPEALFPAAKLKVKSDKAKSTPSTLKKADVYLTFKRELGAVVSDDFVYVPIGNYVLVIVRHVFLRVPTWMCQGLYEKRQGGYAATGKPVGGTIGFSSIYEEWAHMTPLFNALKSLQQQEPAPEVIVNTMKNVLAHIKGIPTELGSKPYPIRGF